MLNQHSVLLASFQFIENENEVKKGAFFQAEGKALNFPTDKPLFYARILGSDKEGSVYHTYFYANLEAVKTNVSQNFGKFQEVAPTSEQQTTQEKENQSQNPKNSETMQNTEAPQGTNEPQSTRNHRRGKKRTGTFKTRKSP